MQNTINTILKYAVITGLAFVMFIPLYVANPLFFPFITGKAFAFRIIVEVIFAIWLILILREKGTSAYGTDSSVVPRVNLITIFVTAFTFIALVADLAGMNPLRSIWSNSERMEGWMTIIHLWAYFIVLSSVFGVGEELRKNWHRFLNVTIIAGTITAIYGLFQYFGWAQIHQGSSRIDASLGNSAYMAVYMLIHVFISAYFAIVNFPKNKILFYIYSILSILFSFILFQTATRGTIIGWVTGIIVACFIYAVWGRKDKGQSNLSRGIAGGAILLILVLTTVFYLNKNAEWIKNSEVLSRLASISIKDTRTQARGYIWPMALDGSFETIKTSLIGWGQENFNYVFNKNYNPKMWAHELWFDRAHNVYLDWLIAGGLLGLISYLLLYITSFVYIIKSNLSLGQKSALIALLVGYSIHNVFVFDNQTSYVMFFTFLAFIYSLQPNRRLSIFKVSDKPITEDYITIRDYIFVPIIVVLLLITLYFVNVRNIQANVRLIDVLRSCSNGGNPSTKYFERALSLNQTTLNQEIREQLISCSINVILSDAINPKTKDEFFLLTKAEIDNQIKTTPNDARIYILGSSFFNGIGDWNSALPLILKARELSPMKQTPMLDLAVNYINTNKSKEAVEIAKQAYELAPDYPVAQSVYVISLISNGEEKRARELFPDSPQLFTDQRIISSYLRNKQYDKAITAYRDVLAKNPNDIDARSRLASVYYVSNQLQKAIEELKVLKTLSPQLNREIDAAIKQIEEGKKI
jgi:O-antigen ligase/protein involved in temperature-dependent protein secretion